MKKVWSLLLVLLLCASLFGCTKPEPDPTPPVDPTPDPDPVPTVELDWIIEPTLSFDMVEVLDEYYAPEIPQRSKYLAFQQGGRWGLMTTEFEIVIAAVSQDRPFFCPFGELHLTADSGTLEALTFDADDIELAAGGHGAYAFDYVYDVDDRTMYVLAGDVGFDLYLPSEYPDTIPSVVPVAFVTTSEDDPYGWGAEVEYLGTYGFCRNDGTLISAVEYEYACAFINGLAAVRRGGAWGYVDPTLAAITTFSYRGCVGNHYNNDGTFTPDYFPYFFLGDYAVVRDLEGKYGVIDKTGEEYLLCIYSKIVPVSGNRIVVQVDGLWGLAQLP